MKQVLQAAKGGRTRVADVEAPSLRAGSVLVRTKWSAVSAGTERMVIELAEKSLVGKARARPDLVKKTIEKMKREGVLATYRAVTGRLSGDVPLGYSAAGEVIAVADGVTGISPGDRVACAGAGAANHAEVLCVPRNLCARVPEGVDLRHASMATLGAIALHGVRTADVRLGETAVVIGLGLLGQMTVQMLRASGVRVVAIDRDAARAALAVTLGADVAFGSATEGEPDAAVRGLTSGQGADAVLVCAATDSSEPLALAARLCRKRGVVTIVGAVGMELDRRLYYERELSVRMSTSYGPGRYDPAYEDRGIDYPYAYVRWTEGRNLEGVLDLMARGGLAIEPLITHTFAIEDGEAAYDLVRGDRAEPYMGILLRYEGDGGAATAAQAVPSGAPASRPTKGGAPTVSVIGAGQFAVAVLLPAFKDAGATFDAVASAGGVSADAAKRSYGFARVLSADQVIASNTDAVAILTRHDTHAALVIAAIAAGKACFVEKPLAITRESLDEVIAAMRARPSCVTVGFNRRFARATEVLRAQLASRRSPIHVRFRANAGAIPMTHWTQDLEVGGGRIVGEACHFLDLMSFVVGSPIARVQAERVGEDGASAILRFGDGSTGTMEYVTTGDASLAKEHMEVFHEGDAFVLDDFRKLTRHRGGRALVLWKGSQDKGHRKEIGEFLRAVSGGLGSPVPFDEAVAATLASFAVLDAIALGVAIDLQT